MNTGNVRIEYGPHQFDKQGNVIRATNDNQVVHLEYRAPEVIEEGKHMGKKTKPEFSKARIFSNRSKTSCYELGRRY